MATVLKKKKKKLVQEIIAVINDVLETTWTNVEVTSGKEVDIEISWRSHIGPLVEKYRGAGWIITRKVEINTSSPGCPRDYLIFVNPAWLECPSELRSTGVKR
jgi:hypothetical protein